MTKTELKQAVVKIKKFLKQRDYDAIDTGIELARGLDEPAVFEAFLGGCAIDEHGRLVRSSSFSGTGPAQPYLDYALWNLIGYAPDTCNIDKSLKKKNIKTVSFLSTTFIGVREYGLKKIPPGFYNFKNLKFLDISRTSIEMLPKEILPLKYIEKISIVRMPEIGPWRSKKPRFNFKDSFEILKDLKKLKVLEIGSNNLFDSVDVLPDTICNLTNLTKLVCNNSEVKTLPADIGNLVQLEILDFKDCKIESLPESIGNLKKLKILNLNANILKSLPSVIGQLKSLEDLILDGSGFSSIPSEIGRLKNLKRFIISENKLSSIPSEIGKLLNLEILDLRKNNISIYPVELCALKKLKLFNGEYGWNSTYQEKFTVDNPLLSIPGNIFNLPWTKKLTSVNLSDCKLKSMPEQMCTLSQLEKLNVSNNKLTSIPQNIGLLKNLKDIDLSGNEIASLPGEFSKLPNLKKLNLNSNPLLTDVVPLAELPNLEYLSFNQDCSKVIPLPSKSGYSGREKVKTYQRRILKEYNKAIPTEFKNKKPRLSGELKSTLVKLKKFLKSKDYDTIDQGIELVRSLDDPNIYSALLGGWYITEDGELSFEYYYKGETLTKVYSAKTWRYFAYAVWNLIGYANQKSKLHDSIYINNINTITITEGPRESGSGYWDWKKNLMPNVPEGICNFKNLKKLTLKRNNISSLPNNISALIDLEYLCISSTNINEFPASFYKLSSLKTLDLSATSFSEMPDELGKLLKLQSLELRHCDELENVSGLINSTNLTSIDLYDSDKIEDVDGLINCKNLTTLDLSGCSSLKNVDGLINCKNLTTLDLSGCSSLKNIDGLINCKNLTTLDLSGCSLLKNIDGLANLFNLTSLDMSSCDSLQNLRGLSNCKNLITLDIMSCNSLTNLDGLANCSGIVNIDLYGCTGLKDISGLGGLKTLLGISISGGRPPSSYNQDDEITRLPIGFDKINSLETLNISYSNLIKDIDSLANCKNLTALNLQYCTSIQNVNGLKTCNNLLSVNLDECESLNNVEGLAYLNNLESLRLSKCKNVKPKPSPVIMDTREKVEKFQKRIKNSTKNN